jgi:ubiquinone/menaquinone biosynthesis C-methylase UbiE
MPSMFNARDADNYERLMGRWSRRLAPLFIEHAGIADGENVIEVGCGTGSLTFTLPQKAALGRLTAVDHSEIYLAAAKAKNKDPRISLEQGDGCALRFPDASFDRALSMLVLPSVLPEPELMVIHGNAHMIMLEKNNLQVSAVIARWLARTVPAR